MAVEQDSQSSNKKASAKSAQDEAMAQLRARREAKEKEAAEKAAAEAKAAQDEAMAHLRARREAKEKEDAADAAQAIKAAEKDEMELFKAQKQNKAKSAKLSQEAEAAAETAVAPSRKWEFFAEHTVAPGENLSKISEKYYGNQGYWKPLYDANQAVIGDNPNVIVPGQTLKIPKL